MTEAEIQNFDAFDAFDDADEKQGDQSKVHIRVQQRNGRKCITTVQGLADDLDPGGSAEAHAARALEEFRGQELLLDTQSHVGGTQAQAPKKKRKRRRKETERKRKKRKRKRKKRKRKRKTRKKRKWKRKRKRKKRKKTRKRKSYILSYILSLYVRMSVSLCPSCQFVPIMSVCAHLVSMCPCQLCPCQLCPCVVCGMLCVCVCILC